MAQLARTFLSCLTGLAGDWIFIPTVETVGYSQPSLTGRIASMHQQTVKKVTALHGNGPTQEPQSE